MFINNIKRGYLIMVGITLFFFKVSAHDILVKTDNSRILTTVTHVTDKTVDCKGIASRPDTIFTISTSELKMIIYQVGNIQYFNGEKKPDNEYYQITQPQQLQPRRQEVKESDHKSNYTGSIELGTGYTAGFLKNSISYGRSSNNSFEFNLRALARIGKDSKVILGGNLNYSNNILIDEAQRISVMFAAELIVEEDKNNILYFNFMAGIGHFSSYNTGTYYSHSTLGIYNLPMFHIGFGGKYFFNNSNLGILYEIGLGGPYIINLGVLLH